MTGGNQRKAIRSVIARIGPHGTPRQIVEELAGRGIDVSESHVVRVKLQMLRSEARAEVRRRPLRVKDRRKRRPQQRKIPSRPG